MRILNYCPKCKSFSKIPILYGYPSKEGMQKAKDGKIVLGGCMVRSSNPKWKCKKCGYRWGGKRESIVENKHTAKNISSSISYNSNHKSMNQEVKMRDKWETIGEWQTYTGCEDRFEGYIPLWIKKRIPVYLGQVGKDFKGIKYVHDKHYSYKLVFMAGDETNSCVICRKRRIFRNLKNIRPRKD